MATDRETVDGVLMDNDNASYDKAAKRFLSMKMLLAWILKYLVAEFRDCSIKDIAEKYIEGDPTLTIGTIPVDADLTNAARNTAKKKAKNIKGSRNEDASTTEGTAIFDILFRAIVPATGETIALIINIEPQRTVYTGYSLVRRGIYYACRMISSLYIFPFSHSYSVFRSFSKQQDCLMLGFLDISCLKPQAGAICAYSKQNVVP